MGISQMGKRDANCLKLSLVNMTKEWRGSYSFAGRVDPTALYFFKFSWGDIGETKSSKNKKTYMFRIRASENQHKQP